MISLFICRFPYNRGFLENSLGLTPNQAQSIRAVAGAAVLSLTGVWMASAIITGNKKDIEQSRKDIDDHREDVKRQLNEHKDNFKRNDEDHRSFMTAVISKTDVEKSKVK